MFGDGDISSRVPSSHPRAEKITKSSTGRLNCYFRACSSSSELPCHHIYNAECWRQACISARIMSDDKWTGARGVFVELY